MGEKMRGGIWAAVLVAAPLYVFGTFNHDLWRPAEAREAGIAREMIETGNWVATYLNGKLFLEKPPLYTWMIAGPLLVFGYQDWAVRIFVLVFTLATLAATYGLARCVLPARAAQAALIALATMCLFLEVNHGAMIDNGLVFFVLTAMLSAFVALESDCPRRRRWAALLFYVLAGLIFLCKGAVGVVLIGGALCGYLWHMRQWEKIPRLYPLAGMLIFALIAGAWLLALWRRGGAGYFEIFFIENHFKRFLGTYEPTKVRWYYLPYLFAVAMPWTILVPDGIRYMRERGRENSAIRRFYLFLLWWIGAMFVILNVAGGKGHQYLMPILPPMAVLAGAWVDAVIAAKHPLRGWSLWALYLFVVLVVIVGVALPLAPMWLTGERLAGGVLLAVGMAGAGCLALVRMRRQEWRVVWRALAVIAVLAGLTFGWSWERWLNQRKSMRPLAQALAQGMPAGAELWGYKLSENTAGGLIFYGQPARPFYGFDELRDLAGDQAYVLIMSYAPGRGPAAYAEKLPGWMPVFFGKFGRRYYLLMRRGSRDNAGPPGG